MDNTDRLESDDGDGQAQTDGGVVAVDGQTGSGRREVEVPEGSTVSLEVPDGVDVDTENVVPAEASDVVTVEGQANSGGSSVNPIADERTVDLDSRFSDLLSDFHLIDNDRIDKLRNNRVDYTEDVGEWIIQNDDRIPAILQHQNGLILGQDGLQVEPADPDNEADNRLAEHLGEVYKGESDVENPVKPAKVCRKILEQNYMAAMSVLRAGDLAELPLDTLTYFRDPEDGEEFYIQESVSYTTLEVGEDDGNGSLDFEEHNETAEETALRRGEHVFDAQLYHEVPLKAIADITVNKLVLQRLKARKAEIASVGGLYIKVKPPDWLKENEYSDTIPDPNEPDDSDETVKKLEQVMREELSNAIDTLEGYQSGFIMSVPNHWEVEQVEIPDTGEKIDDQIRGYNQAIAARLMFPLDLMELKEGSEMSRDTIFRTLLTTISGWRREILNVFDGFADVQKDIHNLSGSVEHSFPKLESEDEKLLIDALKMAGLAGMSQAEVRQTLNAIEGLDLEVDESPEPEEPTEEPPSGPMDRQEREEQAQDQLDTFGDEPSPDDTGGQPAGAEASDPLGEAYTPPEGLDLHELDGWNQASVWDAYLSLGASHTTCSKRMATEVRNADAWCAALKDSALGTDLWRKGSGMAPPTEPTPVAMAASPTTYKSGQSLDTFADTVKSVVQSNTDQGVETLETDDDFVALTVGGVDPSSDDDTDDFQPVVVVDVGGDEYSVQGPDSLLDGVSDEAAGEATRPWSRHVFGGVDDVEAAAAHVEAAAVSQVTDNVAVDSKTVDDDTAKVHVEASGQPIREFLITRGVSEDNRWE